jgi:hypothetical protein
MSCGEGRLCTRHDKLRAVRRAADHSPRGGWQSHLLENRRFDFDGIDANTPATHLVRFYGLLTSGPACISSPFDFSQCCSKRIHEVLRKQEGRNETLIHVILHVLTTGVDLYDHPVDVRIVIQRD